MSKSRQSLWREKHKQAGRCVQCPRKARTKQVGGVERTLSHCAACAAKQAARSKSKAPAKTGRSRNKERVVRLTIRQVAIAEAGRNSDAGAGAAAGS